MKTKDNSFSGFPGCWNMVVLVLFAVAPSFWFILARGRRARGRAVHAAQVRPPGADGALAQRDAAGGAGLDGAGGLRRLDRVRSRKLGHLGPRGHLDLPGARRDRAADRRAAQGAPPDSLLAPVTTRHGSWRYPRWCADGRGTRFPGKTDGTSRGVRLRGPCRATIRQRPGSRARRCRRRCRHTGFEHSTRAMRIGTCALRLPPPGRTSRPRSRGQTARPRLPSASVLRSAAVACRAAAAKRSAGSAVSRGRRRSGRRPRIGVRADVGQDLPATLALLALGLGEDHAHARHLVEPERVPRRRLLGDGDVRDDADIVERDVGQRRAAWCRPRHGPPAPPRARRRSPCRAAAPRARPSPRAARAGSRAHFSASASSRHAAGVSGKSTRCTELSSPGNRSSQTSSIVKTRIGASHVVSRWNRMSSTVRAARRWSRSAGVAVERVLADVEVERRQLDRRRS